MSLLRNVSGSLTACTFCKNCSVSRLGSFKTCILCCVNRKVSEDVANVTCLEILSYFTERILTESTHSSRQVCPHLAEDKTECSQMKAPSLRRSNTVSPLL